MDAPSPSSAWQPITPAGVAAFAYAPLRRLLLVQFVVALLVGLAAAWFAYDAYVPVIDEVILRLPASGEMKAQELRWGGESPTMLGENRFLALSVDLQGSAKLRSTAHFQIEFSRRDVAIHSLFGYLGLPYPTGWQMAANREVLEPAWGAWRPMVLVLILLGVAASLMAIWFLLATLWALPIWIYAQWLGRQLSLRGSWRLSGAALMPGALLMVAALSCYDLGVIDLAPMVVVFLAHLILGWIYLGWSPRCLRRKEPAGHVSQNPFAAQKSR